MEANSVEISVKGHAIKVPSVKIGGRTIIVYGRWLNMAWIKDANWLEGEVVTDPEACVKKLRQEKLNADIFTFSQKLPNIKPNYAYPMEWDNVAAIPTTDYSYWWEHRLPQETRKNVRRAGRRGVVLREVPFSDQLLQGIVEINNETPLRQGRPFWHYEKSFDVVKKDYTTLLDRSEFIGAYYENKLIGFIKMIYMGEIAGILQLLCMNKHYDKRPANALTARAVEICHSKGLKYLIYGKYIYGNNSKSPLTEFKRRNGFEQILLPKYYVPLTIKGKMAIQLRLHQGLKGLLPNNFIELASKLRAWWYEKTLLSGNKYISE
jgi:hypothetical protein